MLKFVFLVQMNNNCKLLSLNDYQKNTCDINDFNRLFYILFRSFFGNTQYLLLNLSPDKDLSYCNFVHRYTPPEPAACSCSQVLYAKKILSIVSK